MSDWIETTINSVDAIRMMAAENHMYASNSQENLEESDEIEGVLYRRYQEVYQKLKAAKEGE